MSAQVLVVDAEVAHRQAAREVLEKAGHLVAEAANVSAAVAMVEKGGFDVVVTSRAHRHGILGECSNQEDGPEMLWLADEHEVPVDPHRAGETFLGRLTTSEAKQRLLQLMAQALRSRSNRMKKRHPSEGGSASRAYLEKLVEERTAALRSTNRALAVLSQCNEALVRAKTEDWLLTEICRVLVEVGGYRFAWVGLVQHDHLQSVQPVAQAGAGDGYLDGVTISWCDGPSGAGPAGRAIRSRQPVAAKNIHTDPSFGPWRAAAEKRGFAASIALPLLEDDAVFAVINIYAAQADAFDDQVEKLFVRLTNSLAYGITALRTRVEHQRALQDKVLLATVVEQSAETVMIAGPDGRLQYVNPAFEQTTGYASEKAVGQSPALLRSNQHDRAFYAHMWKLLKRGETWSGRLVNKRKDGRLYTVDATISPMHAPSGEAIGYVSVQRDITERIEFEKQLREAARMEAIGRLAGGIAHDFNNLLTVIMASCEFLADEVSEDDPLAEDVRNIKDAGSRAVLLTRQLLTFSRKQTVCLKVLNLNDTIGSMESMLERLSNEDVVLKFILDPDLGRIEADTSQLQQVVVNLLVNSCDAMPGGGELTLRTRNVDVGTDESLAGASSEKRRYILFSVEDNGMGMDEETRTHVFEPFFTTKEVGKGTGLGLSTVFGIVSQCNGFIRVQSESGKGCRVDIYLPRVDRPLTSPHSSEAQDTGNKLSLGETILVVEDEPEVRSLACRILLRAGYRVLEASSGPEALVYVAGKQRIDLVFTDMVMPEMSGQALMQRIVEIRPNLKVMFTSGYPDDTIARHGALPRGIKLIPKPYSSKVLTEAVWSVLDCRQGAERQASPARETGVQ